MKNMLLALSATLAFGTLAAPVAFAQSSAHTSMAGDHMMVTPDELKWVDVPSLPPGAKLAVIEGPLNQAVPGDLSREASCELPDTGALASGDRTRHGDLRYVQHGNRRQAGPSKDEGSDRRRRCDHAAEDQSLCLDQGRNDRSGARNGTMGCDLRESGGRSAQAIAISGGTLLHGGNSNLYKRMMERCGASSS